MKVKSIYFVTLVFLAVLLCPIHSDAFKIETHVWVGQQVLNDVLDDGKVTIEPFGDFEVANDIKSALENNQDEYRMGTLGPDSFPDMVGGQMTVHPGDAIGGWATDKWLKHVLSNAETPREKAVAYGYVTHASSDLFAHTYVNLYAGDFFDIIDEQEVELRHMALEDYIKNHMPPLMDLSGSILPPYVDPPLLYNQEWFREPAEYLRDMLILDDTAAGQYTTAPTALLKFMHDHWKVHDSAIEQLKSLRGNIQNAVNILNADVRALKSIGVDIPFVGKVKLFPTYCYTTFDFGTCALIVAKEKVMDAFNDILTITLFEPAIAPLELWQNELEEAMTQYIMTSLEVSNRIMKHDDNEKPMGAVTHWATCWLPVFSGIPGGNTNPACTAIYFHQEVTGKLDDLRTAINDEVRSLGGPIIGNVLASFVDPLEEIDHIKNKVLKPAIEDKILDLSTKLTGPNSTLTTIVTMRTEDYFTPEQLNAVFREDNNSGKGLREFEDVAGMVDSDMGRNPTAGDSKFDPEVFSPVYNAVVLSKLLLLAPDELSRIVHMAGIENTIYGSDLYSDRDEFNILYDAVRSIDGNHQWQEYAPPYLRKGTDDDGKDPEERRFGYSFSDQNKGFRFWEDCEVREKVFTQIFKGPIAPSLEGNSNPFPVSADTKTQKKFWDDDRNYYAWSNSRDPRTKLVVPLDLPACGDDLEGMSYSWTFYSDYLYCEFNCNCTKSLGSINKFDCTCTSSEPGCIPNQSWASDSTNPNTYRYTGFSKGSFVVPSEFYSPGDRGEIPYPIVQAGALEWNGSLICSSTSASTNIVMLPDSYGVYKLHAHNRSTGDVLYTSTKTIYMAGPRFDTTNDWRVIDDVIKAETDNELDACKGVPNPCELKDNYDGTITDVCGLRMWTADANHMYNNGLHWSPRMTYDLAEEAVNGLRVSFYTDWRLPESKYPDDSCTYPDPTAEYNSQDAFDFGYNCTKSELGHLYYRALGNYEGNLTNPGPFDNIVIYTPFPINGQVVNIPLNSYWMKNINYPSAYDKFDFYTGKQEKDPGMGDRYGAWSVREIQFQTSVSLDSFPDDPDIPGPYSTPKVGLIGHADSATTIDFIASPDNPGADVPGFRFLDTFYDLIATGYYKGELYIGLPYLEFKLPPGTDENDLRLMHLDNGDWKDITDRVDTVNNKVYGKVNSLSWFGLAVPEVVLNPITDLSARAKSGKADLVWGPIIGAQGYNIYRATSSGGSYELIAENHQSDYCVFADYGLTNGVTYYYIVRWLDANGNESPDSNEASATPQARRRRR